MFLNSKKELSQISRTARQKICKNLRLATIIMTDFTAKEQIFLLYRMIGNLWLFLDSTSLFTDIQFRLTL